MSLMAVGLKTLAEADNNTTGKVMMTARRKIVLGKQKNENFLNCFMKSPAS